MDAKKKQARMMTQQKRMIQGLEKTMGIVTSACKNVGVARGTHYKWMKECPDYAKEVESIGDIALDFAESKLHRQILDGVPASTMFYLKCKGKGRGYIERSEVTTHARHTPFDHMSDEELDEAIG